jgi:hypothetical protein
MTISSAARWGALASIDADEPGTDRQERRAPGARAEAIGRGAYAQTARGVRQPARTEAIAGSRVATPNQLAPASTEPKISPEVAPK